MKRDAIHSVSPLLILFALLVVPGAASAQEPPVAPADTSAQKPQERATGLPAPVKWTFNFDAGWGTFGFGNSLFLNSGGAGRTPPCREPKVGTLWSTFDSGHETDA